MEHYSLYVCGLVGSCRNCAVPWLAAVSCLHPQEECCYHSFQETSFDCLYSSVFSLIGDGTLHSGGACLRGDFAMPLLDGVFIGGRFKSRSINLSPYRKRPIDQQSSFQVTNQREQKQKQLSLWL